MNRDMFRQVLVIIAVVATIIMNGLANALPLNGQNTGEISDRFQVYFVPAGYVFSIWGLIYVGLIAYAIYQAMPAQRDNPRLQATGYLFVFSCVANIAWIVLWHYEFFLLTLVAMVALLFLLIAIYLRLGIGRTAVSPAERWLVHLTFSIYLGWVSVATIANVTSVLDYVKWGGWGLSPELWTALMLLAGVILAGAMAFTRGDVAYGLVLIWAFIGIALKHSETAFVATAAWVAVGLVVLGLAGAIFLYKGRKADMPWRLNGPDRIGQAGIDKIRLGVLLGLTDWRTDAVMLAQHLQYLQKRYWQARQKSPYWSPTNGGDVR